MKLDQYNEDVRTAMLRNQANRQAMADEAHLSGWWRGLLAGFGLGLAVMMLMEMLR